MKKTIYYVERVFRCRGIRYETFHSTWTKAVIGKRELEKIRRAYPGERKPRFRVVMGLLDEFI